MYQFTLSQLLAISSNPQAIISVTLMDATEYRAYVAKFKKLLAAQQFSFTYKQYAATKYIFSITAHIDQAAQLQAIYNEACSINM